ncbi:phage tail protein [Citrobacter freundii]|nr:phage tail protein [Citrobacter freundii]QMD58877.1 phage tail protein [Citrobacter freundii]
MSQAVITKVFSEWKAQQAINNQPVTLDEFIFAYIPGLDVDKPIDNTETIPAADKIVYRQAVSKSGVVNENSVVYSVTLGADVGDFDFNWIGLANKATGTLAMIIHAPTQRKIKNANGQQGNVLVRSMLMEYSGAREATEITTPAETWQIDFTARLAAMDERQRRENIDLYGAAAFFDSGYLVAKSGNQFFVTKGAGYVAGLRAELPADLNITASAKPTKVWLDVSWTGTLTSEWAVQSKITVAADLANYVLGGVQHYVFAVASIDAAGNITDLRPKGTLNDQAASDALRRHEQSRNHPDATTSEKGFTQLSSATDSTSEGQAATPKAVKIAMDNAGARLAKERNGGDILNPALFRQNIGIYDASTSQKGLVRLNGGVTDESNETAATSGAVKIAYDTAIAAAEIAKKKWSAVEATTSQKGIVMLSDNTGAPDSKTAATTTAVNYVLKQAQYAYELAQLKYTADGATITNAGLVQLVNSMGGSSSLVMPQAAVTTAIQTYPSLGKGQTLQDLKSSRGTGVTYTNSTGFPIAVYVRINGGTSANLYAYINGIEFGGGGATALDTSLATAFFIVPPGFTYRVDASGISTILRAWTELR